MTDLFQDPNLDMPTIDESKKYFEELVGEGKKFSDPEALARGKFEADIFVERLKQENAGIRNELNSRVKMEEFLDKLNSFQKPQSPDAGQQPPDQAKVEAGLKPEDVLRLLDQREQLSKATQNVNKVQVHLQETLGPNYATKLKQVADSLGLSKEHINNLAATSPEALYKVLGLEAGKKQDLFQAPPRSQMTPGFQPKGTGKDWDYFEAMRKKESAKYWSASVQNEMHDLRKKGLLKVPGDEG